MRKGITMKRFLALVLIAALGVFTIGCETKKGTTENKTKTTTTQTKDGKVTGETDDHDDRHDEDYPPGYSRRCRHDDRKDDRDDHRDDQVVLCRVWLVDDDGRGSRARSPAEATELTYVH